MQFSFVDSLSLRTMILWCIGGADATEEAQDDGIERSVPGAAGQIINMKHELVQLAGKIDWDWIDGEVAPLYSENGRPGIETRFMIGLLLLKHTYGLSDEGVCERWVHDPYFQFFTGQEFFQHAFPHERSDLSHWRKRLGDKFGAAAGGEPAGGARGRRVTRPGPQARHRRHHGAAEGHHLSDRCQAASC
ncbi:hypothetical protein ACVWYI_000529 [Bradyrhizobium sp. LB13.1]